MVAKAKQLVSGAAGAPVLISYSSDGTPISTRKRATATSSSDVSVTRTGKTTEELLVQHACVRYLDSRGVAHSRVVLQEPLPLTNGKSAWALLSRGVDFLPTARQMGHHGISVCHYAFDRAAYSALARHFKQYHEHLSALQCYPAGGTSPRLLQLTEWVVSTPCGLHDTHNSLKWSLFAIFCNTELISDCYIVIESLRNSAQLLFRYMGEWIQDRLRFVPEDCLPQPQDLYELWTCLGVDPEAIEVVSEELRLQWKDGLLCVKDTAASSQNIVGQVSFALLSVWKFKKFSSSRWVSVGCSCRSLVASLLTGLESLVAKIRADPVASDWNIHGFGKLSADARHFMVLAAMVAYPSDALLSELMEDARIPRRLTCLVQAVDAEVQWLADVGPTVWDTLASLLEGSSGQGLRSDCLHAVHISRGFMKLRFFSAAAQLPWSLAQGDKDANLQALKAGPQPQEPIAAKIWTLLHLGFNKHQLKQGLELLLDCPWGTASAEQQHASATATKRLHEEYSTESLRLKSLGHTLRLLLPSSSAEEKQLQKARASIGKLESKKPQHLGGRQLYYRDLMHLAKEWRHCKKKSFACGC